MAGDWIPIRLDLHEDPAVLGVARRCQIPRTQVVGCLVQFWGLLSRQSVDGSLPNYGTGDVDRVTDVPGFAAALIEEGWLAEHADGLSVPNFEVWCSSGAKKRLKEARKKRVQRAKAPAGRGDKSPQGGGDICPDGVGTKQGTRGEDRTEEKKNPPTPRGGKRGKRAGPPGAERVREDWEALYLAKHEEPYAWQGKDARATAAALKYAQGDVAAVRKRMLVFLSASDGFWAKNQNLAYAVSVWNSLTPEAVQAAARTGRREPETLNPETWG